MGGLNNPSQPQSPLMYAELLSPEEKYKGDVDQEDSKEKKLISVKKDSWKGDLLTLPPNVQVLVE